MPTVDGQVKLNTYVMTIKASVETEFQVHTQFGEEESKGAVTEAFVNSLRDLGIVVIDPVIESKECKPS